MSAPDSRLGRRSTLVAALGVGVGALAGCDARGVVTLRGAGATLPHQLYLRWIERYAALVPSVHVDYQAVGSAIGLRQLYARMTDFGGSDAPARAAPFALLHVPVAVGAVALAHRLPGLSRPLVLRPTAIAAIFSGGARRWTDRRIAADNPGVELPDLPIVPVFRADGSGATQIFSEWLVEVGGARQSGMVARFSAGIGARGSDGVAGAVARIPGALGYVELAHARAAGLFTAAVASRDGAPAVELHDRSVDAAASTLPADRPLTWRLGAGGGDGYPLTSFTYLVLPRDMVDDVRSSAVARFTFWALGPGQADCAPLGHRPLPAAIVARARALLTTELRAGERPALRAD